MADEAKEAEETTEESPQKPRSFWQIWRWELHWQILVGLVLGGLLGLALGQYGLSFSDAEAADGATARELVVSSWFFQLADLFGDLFLNGLKLIVIPLVTSSIVIAIGTLGGRAGFGKMGLGTLGYYMLTSTLAIVVGLALVNAVAPGNTKSGKPLLGEEEVAEFEANFADESDKLTKTRENSQSTSLLDVFRRMIPDNPVAAAVEGNLLGLIVVAIMVGFFLSQIAAPLQQTMTRFFEGVYEITMGITNLVLHFAPIGVGMLLFTTVAENYATLGEQGRFGEFITSVISFGVTAFVGLMIHLFVVLPILLLICRVNPIKHFRAMFPALLTAFSTSSSNATLPVTMECVERRAGVSKRTSSFVLPLGATINMDGTALYECVAAMFIVQAFGIELSFAQQFFVVVVALLTSIGVAGVPSASLVAIVIILDSLTGQLHEQGALDAKLDLAKGLPILMVFDRVLDMCRTSVNIFSDSCGAVVVARTQGETGLYPEHTEPLVD